MNANDVVVSLERPTGELQEKAQEMANLAVRDGFAAISPSANSQRQDLERVRNDGHCSSRAHARQIAPKRQSSCPFPQLEAFVAQAKAGCPRMPWQQLKSSQQRGIFR